MAQSSFGEMGIAVKVYGSMPRKNIMSSNVLISGLVRNGDLEGVRKLFDEMRERNVESWNGMIAGLVREGRFEEGLGLFVEVIGEGFSPDRFSLGSVVSGCAGLEGLGIGRQVHSYDGDRIMAALWLSLDYIHCRSGFAQPSICSFLAWMGRRIRQVVATYAFRTWLVVSWGQDGICISSVQFSSLSAMGRLLGILFWEENA
ncbi:hypothetical protein Droror1_Dr00022674 [Drosera rotundifolia]